MAQRTAVLDYRTSGTGGARSNVVSLAEALERQKRAADNLAPSLQRTTLNSGAMGAMFQSATARISSTTNAIGPLGAGLGAVARLAPQAGMGMIQMAAAAERASLMSRALNTTILAGSGTMIAGAVTAAAYADDVIRAGDAYASLKAKIAIYTGSAVEAAQVERQLYANARATRSAVEGQTTLYSRLVPAVLDYGKGQEYAMKVTELTTKALAIQGAEAREQWASTIQFSQAIGSGVLRGDEFRTLREAAPLLLRYVAKNLEINGKIGTSFSNLKTLADEGLLSTGKILDALMRAGPQIEEDFARAPVTAQQGWVILKDKIVQTAGGFAIVTGAQRGLFDWLVKLTDQVEAFRTKMLMDPGAFDGVRAAADFMGDLVGSIGDLGQVAVQNFDLIVAAGQAVIALKLGEVFAGWFASAATASRQALENLRTFQAQARASAAATMNPAAAAAATGLRDGALALSIRASELSARADVAAAQAAAAKAAADRAVAHAADMRALHGAGSVAAAEAETAATAQVALATKLEADAKRAETAATTASSAAAIRNVAAQEAEAIATAGVTSAAVAKNAVQKAALGLYGLLGGAIGIATLALGALIFAVWKVKEAHEAEVRAMHDKLVVSDRLRALTDQLAAATWSEVPAIRAKIAELKREAAASREAAEAELQRLKAKRARLMEEQRGLGIIAPSPGAQALRAFDWIQTQRRIDVLEPAVTAANQEAWRRSMEDRRAGITSNARLAERLRSQLSTGLDDARRPLTPEARARAEAALAALFAKGQAAVDALSTAVEMQQAEIDKEKDPAAKQRLINGLALFGEQRDAAMALVNAADRPTSAPPAPTAGKPKSVSIPGPVSSALDELLRQQYRPKEGLGRFTLSGGMIQDAVAGGTFAARSEDEAAAAAKYVQQIEGINKLSAAQVAKLGESREALRQAASARLAYAISTSQAAQAEDRWADMLAEASGESRATVRAERDIAEMRDKGATITDEMAEKYLAFVKVREAARKAAAAADFAAPLAKDAADKVLAGTSLPTRASGVVDLEAAIRLIESRRAAIVAETEALIRAKTEAEVESGQISREASEALLAQRIAANKVAVEAELQDRILKLTKQRADEQAEIDEARAKHAADVLEGAFHDLVFGGDMGDIGKRIASDLLEAIYQELIGNPLRKLIKDLVRSILHPAGGHEGGAGGGVREAGRNLLSGAIGKVAGWLGFDGGGYTGDVGRRRIAGVVHGQEFVVNAEATAQWLPLLAAINSGKLKAAPGYREGGLVGLARLAWNDDEPYPRPRGASAGQRAAMEAGRQGREGARARPVTIGHIDASIHAPFAESQQLALVAARQREMEAALPDRIVGIVKRLFGR